MAARHSPFPSSANDSTLRIGAAINTPNHERLTPLMLALRLKYGETDKMI